MVRRSGLSAHEEVASALRGAIRAGEYAGGRRLPTEAELSERFSVSRQTVRRAMTSLVSEGLVYRVAGRGTFAVEAADRYIRHFGSIEDLMALSLDTECRIVSPPHDRVDVESAGRLRLANDTVTTLSFVRLHEEIPFCLTVVHLPPAIGRLLSDVEELAAPGARSRATVIGLIDARLPGRIQRAEQSITAVAATEAIADRLGRAPGSPLLRVDRVYLDRTGEPVELAVSHFDPEHYSYRVRLSRQLP